MSDSSASTGEKLSMKFVPSSGERGRKRQLESVNTAVATKKKCDGPPVVTSGCEVQVQKVTCNTVDSVYRIPRLGEVKDPAVIICQLGRAFYDLGWVSGTGGGISIKSQNGIYVAPSGVQKELLNPEDIFVIAISGNYIVKPPDPYLKISQCTPLFLEVYKCRNSGAVMHSHSKFAVLATLFFPGNEFRVTHLEMIKGIYKPTEGRNLNYDEELVVPIIENTSYESDLTNDLSRALYAYPDTNAVLVRRHGVYVWGSSWEKTKTMAECYDYLFDLACKMKQLKINPSVKPEDNYYN